MLEQSDGLLLDELVDHVAEDSADGVEALVRLADVGQTDIVQEDLLDDEDGNGLGKLGSGFHNAQAQRDDLGCEEEVDDFARVVLDKSANHTKGCKTEVLKWA
jgi:hypothetical protein